MPKTMKTIRIDKDVWEKLNALSTSLSDTPNKVLRRTLGLENATRK